MATIICSNFGEFGTLGEFFEYVNGGSGDLNLNTTEYNSILGLATAANGRAIHFGNNAPALYKAVPAVSEYYLHMRCCVDNLSTSTAKLIFFQENVATTTHCNLQWRLDGFIELVGPAGSVIATSSASYLRTVGHDFQIHIKVHDTTGVFQLRMDGGTTNVIDFSGDTRNAGTGVVGAIGWSTTTGSRMYVSDLMVNDTTGSAGNSWTGQATVLLHVPNANGATGVQFTPSAGSNYQNVDDTIPGTNDGDTTYNESSTAGQIDYFSWPSSDYTGVTGAVQLVQFIYFAKAPDGGDHSMRAKAKSGGTTVNGTTQKLGTGYTRFAEPYYTDPSTGSAWASLSAVTSAEFGYEMVS